MQIEYKKLQKNVSFDNRFSFILQFINISFENFKWTINKNLRNVGEVLIIYPLERTHL